jgi:hypothetical protein
MGQAGPLHHHLFHSPLTTVTIHNNNPLPHNPPQPHCFCHFFFLRLYIVCPPVYSPLNFPTQPRLYCRPYTTPTYTTRPSLNAISTSTARCHRPRLSSPTYLFHFNRIATVISPRLLSPYFYVCRNRYNSFVINCNRHILFVPPPPHFYSYSCNRHFNRNLFKPRKLLSPYRTTLKAVLLFMFTHCD